MACSTIVDERQRHGKRRIRLDLSNGMRLAPLTNVADDSLTTLNSGLAARCLLTRLSQLAVAFLRFRSFG
jgi:hypothetical protein